MHVRCGECGASLELADNERSARCLYCASPNVVPRDGGGASPELALPFVLPRAQAIEIGRRWARRNWLAPRAFIRAPIDEVRGIYVPAFLVSGIARTEYSAEIGENYTVTTGFGKNRRRVVKTEWFDLRGQLDGYVNDIVVTASRGIPNAELQAIEPFDLRAIRRYSPKLVSGWAVEDPTVTPAEAQNAAAKEARDDIVRRLLARMPGDTHRGVSHATRFEDLAFDLALLPVFVLPVRYAADRPAVRLLVNGTTGRVHGRAPTSIPKVIALVVALATLATAVVLAVTQ